MVSKEAPEGQSLRGPTSAIGTPSAELSLGRLRLRRACLRFTRPGYCTRQSVGPARASRSGARSSCADQTCTDEPWWFRFGRGLLASKTLRWFRFRRGSGSVLDEDFQSSVTPKKVKKGYPCHSCDVDRSFLSGFIVRGIRWRGYGQKLR